MNEVLSQLHARMSVRAFLDRPISPEARRAILEAACASNMGTSSSIPF